MRHAVERARHAMKQEAGLDQRHVEGAPVVCADGAMVPAHSCSSLNSARSCSNPGSRNCRTRIELPSIAAQPIRNACVPAPPKRPVVSRSRNSRRPPMPSAEWPRLRHQLQRIVTVGNRRDDLADRQAAVQHVGAVFAIDDDHRAVGVFDDGAAERRARHEYGLSASIVRRAGASAPVGHAGLTVTPSLSERADGSTG